MAEDTSSGERSESPTAKRRADFRRKGQVAQSKEVQTTALFILVMLFWLFYSSYFISNIKEVLTILFNKSGEYLISPPSVMQLTYFLGKTMGLLLAPLFFIVFVTGFFATFLQIGWLFTGHPMIPDLNKLDPIKGMGKFISKKSFVELIKSLSKVLLIGWIAYKTLEGKFDDALLLGKMDINSILVFIGKTALLLMAKVSAIMILLAAIDFAFVKWEMEEKMKMTKQEVKEEMKETDGDPHIKSKIRAIQQQLARNRMMSAVPEADVVITNPTRIAVAIKYNPESMDAPEVLAKGQEVIAGKIREIAREHNIPIVENPPVARLLHKKVQIGQTIPDELFKAVAEILAYIYSLKTTKR
ncbi:MAG: flagellar biosynthesis protein FlhB [Bacteroidetes bacterium]|nr:flagellar biosynthesis protein FlhB [Bacteroidota bacterium]